MSSLVWFGLLWSVSMSAKVGYTARYRPLRRDDFQAQPARNYPLNA